MTARRWSTQALDAAEHTHELERGDWLWLHLDHALHGVGSHACGPEVLPEFRLTAAPAEFSFTFAALQGSPGGEGDDEELSRGLSSGDPFVLDDGFGRSTPHGLYGRPHWFGPTAAESP
jgi:beta-galactosidase